MLYFLNFIFLKFNLTSTIFLIFFLNNTQTQDNWRKNFF